MFDKITSFYNIYTSILYEASSELNYYMKLASSSSNSKRSVEDDVNIFSDMSSSSDLEDI
jgi:hypothetical protein